jgi:transcription elongation factor GreA
VNEVYEADEQSEAGNAPTGDEVEITPAGYERLTAYLQELETVGRRQVAEEIQRASELAAGDIADNVELLQAREEQARLEQRIQDLRERLRRARVVTTPEGGKSVALGRRVVLEDLGTGEQEEFLLVGPLEGNVLEGRMSVASPVGKAISGRQQGETVEVQAPLGTVRYRIAAVRRS